MIARQWIGETREAVADAYFKYLEATGVKECEATKGNQGVWLLRRVHDSKAKWLHTISSLSAGIASRTRSGTRTGNPL